MNTTATVPWWWVAALAGLFTILGGLITVIAGYFSDRRNLTRDDRRQWDPKILKICLEYLDTANNIVTARATTEFRDNRAKILYSLTEKYFETKNALELIAPEELVNAARTFHNDTIEYIGSNEGEGHGNGIKYQECRNKFVAATKHTLFRGQLK